MNTINTILTNNQNPYILCTSYPERRLCDAEAYTTYGDTTTRNEVSLSGTIVHCYSTDKVTVMRVRTLGKHGDCPKVLFFGDARDAANRFELGDAIQIKGHIQTKPLDPEKPNQETSYVVGNTISTLLPEDATGQEAVRNPNRICLKGKVVHTHFQNDMINLVIKTSVNGRQQFVPMNFFISHQGGFSEVKNGDVVSVKGYVQTKEREKDGIRVRFQNFVIKCGTILPYGKEDLVA